MLYVNKVLQQKRPNSESPAISFHDKARLQAVNVVEAILALKVFAFIIFFRPHTVGLPYPSIAGEEIPKSIFAMKAAEISFDIFDIEGYFRYETAQISYLRHG